MPSDMTHVVIHDSVRSIHSSALSYCDHLVEVVFGTMQQQQQQQRRQQLQIIGAFAFERCIALKNISLPPTVIRIGKKSFYECEALMTVQLQEGLRIINDHAFAYCRSLQEIAFPSTVETIGKYAFRECSSLTAVGLMEQLQLRWIGIRAFRDCSALRMISFPCNPPIVLSIGEEAFYGCDSLKVIRLPKNFNLLENRVFSGSDVTKISVPPTIQRIGNGTMAGCRSLEEVEFVDAVEGQLGKIGEFAFADCRFLKSIAVPITVSIIGRRAFGDCERLVEVNLMASLGGNERLRRIGHFAFASCKSLSGIAIPASIELIEDGAFSDCISLMGIEFTPSRNGRVRLGESLFRNCESLVNYFLPPSYLGNNDDYSDCYNLFINTPNDDHQQKDYFVVKENKRNKYRFMNRPVHKACYYASHTKVKDLLHAIEEEDDSDYESEESYEYSYRDFVAGFHLGGEWDQELVDTYGMTPFHILATSGTVRKDLLEVLLEKYPSCPQGSSSENHD
mmetsp:Transcript_12830/g.30472  ORF Transcript_12830/g.30472 Transcript_12830/m.30472 type:complete len:507 (-) Transcript_12830:474-1994(-)